MNIKTIHKTKLPIIESWLFLTLLNILDLSLTYIGITYFNVIEINSIYGSEFTLLRFVLIKTTVIFGILIWLRKKTEIIRYVNYGMIGICFINLFTILVSILRMVI